MPHEYWRVFISAVAGGGGVEYTSADEVEMRESVGGASVCTGGAIIASSEVDLGGNGRASEAYDGSLFTYWVSELSPPQWIGYHFASAKEIVEIAIHNPADDPGNPEALSLEYSDDGIGWTSADNWSGAAWPTAGWQVFTRSAISYGATAAGTPRRPSGASAAHHAPPIAASAAGAPRRPSGSASARYAPPAFAAAAGAPRRPSGSARASHTFRPPPHLLRTSYTLTLALDGLPDLPVPLATWQAVAQSEAATVLTCTAPYSAQLAAALASYTGATLRIDQHLHYTDRTLSGTIVSVPWDGAPRIDRGGRSQTVTLQGRQFPAGTAPPAKLVRLSGVQYVRDDDTGRSVRAGIDFFAAPGDTLDYGDGVVVPDRITYVCSPGLAWMEARG